MKNLIALFCALAPSRKPTVHSVLDSTCSSRGELDFVQGLEVRGSHAGPIKGGEGSLLVIAQGASIEGCLEADTIILRGKVKGSIKARKSLIVGDTGVLSGDAHYMNVQVSEGARIEGRLCSMSASDEQTPPTFTRRVSRAVEMPAAPAALSS